MESPRVKSRVAVILPSPTSRMAAVSSAPRCAARRWTASSTVRGHAGRPASDTAGSYRSSRSVMCSALLRVSPPRLLVQGLGQAGAGRPHWSRGCQAARRAARRPWVDALLTSGGWMLQALLVAYVVTGGWLV